MQQAVDRMSQYQCNETIHVATIPSDNSTAPHETESRGRW